MTVSLFQASPEVKRTFWQLQLSAVFCDSKGSPRQLKVPMITVLTSLFIFHIAYCIFDPSVNPKLLRSGSVVVERSPGMQEVGGSIPGRVKQKTLKFEVLLHCLALSIEELETDWRLEVTIMVWVGTSLLTRGVVFQWASTIKTGPGRTNT